MSKHKYIEPEDNPSGYVRLKRFLGLEKKPAAGAPDTPPKPVPPPVQYKLEFITSFLLGHNQAVEHTLMVKVLDEPMKLSDAEKEFKDQFDKYVARVKREVRTKKFVEATNGMVRSAHVKNVTCRIRSHYRLDA